MIDKKSLSVVNDEMRDLFDRGNKYYRVELDNTFPKCILNNQDNLAQGLTNKDFKFIHFKYCLLFY